MSPHKAMQSGDLILDLGSNGQDFWEVLAAAEVDAGRGGARRSLAGGLEHSELSPSHGRRQGQKDWHVRRNGGFRKIYP